MKTNYPRLTLGVSQCLLGEKVRFDGGHKKNNYIINILGQFVDYIPYCPEVAIGLGIPRPAIRLIGTPDKPKLVPVKDPSVDLTSKMQKYCKSTAKNLPEISGFILKNRSPSCGLRKVKIYRDKKPPYDSGIGLFAKALQDANPLLPMEEEGCLNDPVMRENFIMRIFVYQRWQQLLKSGLSMKKLIDFHMIHKLLIMSTNVSAYRKLGQLIANHKKLPLKKLAHEYIHLLMTALTKKANNKKHTNVLQHIFGYLKNFLSPEDKKELLDVIESYRLGFVPLIVPITLLKHYFRLYPNEYIEQQVYLSPHPDELMLRNHT